MTDEPSIKEIGRLAREIDPGAFTMSINWNSPDRREAEARRVKALSSARHRLQHAT